MSVQAISVSSVHGHMPAGTSPATRSVTDEPGTKYWAPNASPTDRPSRLSAIRFHVVMSTTILPLSAAEHHHRGRRGRSQRTADADAESGVQQ